MPGTHIEVDHGLLSLDVIGSDKELLGAEEGEGLNDLLLGTGLSLTRSSS